MTRRFSSGVPAIADEDMSEWMKYVYMQFDRPANVDGVTVIFAAVDPNGNYMDIDRTTSDSNGYYSFSFRPELEGTYTIIATFEGTEGYFGSFDQTAIVVDPASTAATPMEPEEPEPEAPVEPTQVDEAPLITIEVAIALAVVAVATVAAVVFFVLRRRK